MALPGKVRIVEVGPRDGLQNENTTISTAIKIELIERLAAAGLRSVETGSFVSPRWVPQMMDSAKVFQAIKRLPDVSYPVLVPNLKGLEMAISFGVQEIAVFVSASEGFSQKNIACSRAESIERLRDVAAIAKAHAMKIRGYVSCVAGCPYDGEVSPAEVTTMANALIDLGCYEISLGDTIGVGTPRQISDLIGRVTVKISRERIAMHFHDTYGQGVANVLASLEEGITVFDSSVAGLGGCPYAPGASGNVATEDVLYLLKGLGIETGIDIFAAAETGAWISNVLGKPNASRAGRAMLAKKAIGE